MHHSFSVAHAVEYGVNEAILIQNFYFWISHNRANARHFYDGRTWTYNSVRAFSDLFPYFTTKQVRGVLDRLIERSVLVSGNYNSDTRDRTLWYAFADEDRFLNFAPSHLPEKANASPSAGPLHLPAKANEIAPEGKSLIRTDINTDVKPSARGSRLPKDWTLPKAWGEEAMTLQPTWTSEHVRFEAEKFRDYWIGVAGKAGIKLDWPATWRNWTRNAGPMKTESGKKGGGWWLSPESRLAKAHEVGVGAPLPGESDKSYQARIEAAIDNGGKPPAPRPIPTSTPILPAVTGARTGPTEASREMLSSALSMLRRKNAGADSYQPNQGAA